MNEGGDQQMGVIKKITCDPECGFAVQSHDEPEVLRMASEHVEKVHGKKVPEKELRDMMTTVN
jgi:predicted small metal-binding protein